MTRDYYYILFPDGDEQEISNPLKFNDLVDINGNILKQEMLDNKNITYRVSGIKTKTHFKETFSYYKLELVDRNELNSEIFYQNEIDIKKKYDKKYSDILDKIEKKFKKK